MGHMEERPEGSGHWRLRVHVGDRQYTSETFTGSKREAAKALARLEVKAGQGRAPKPNRQTVAGLLEEYLSDKPWDSVGARRQAEDDIRRYLIPHLGEIRLSRLTDAPITKLYRGLQEPGPGCLARRGRPLANSTVDRLHTTLDAALNWGVRKGRLGRNPTVTVDVPSVPATTVRGPDAGELQHLLAVALTPEQPGGEIDVAFATFVRVAPATGRRRQDILGLTLADLRPDERAVIFERRAVLGGKGVGVVIEMLDKNYRTARVDVDDVTMDRLTALAERRQTMAKSLGAVFGKRGHLFSDDPVGGLPWRPDATSREFRLLRDRAGLPDVTLHGLRHSHITELLESGLDVEAVAKRVGDDPNTIYRVYAHARRTSDRRAAAIMGRALDGAEPGLVALEGGQSGNS